MDNKPTLLVTCGIPGSGKTTFCKNFLNYSNSIHISRDDIRFSMLKNGEDYFSHENEVYNEFVKQIKNGLNQNIDYVIADATHLSTGSRTKLLRNLGSSLKNVRTEAMVFDIPLETALLQNKNREGTLAFVPEEVIRSMFKNFTFPILEEGFDSILYYSSYFNNL